MRTGAEGSMKMFEIERPKAWYSSPCFIIAIIVIIIAAVGVGSYFLLKGGEEDIGEATSLDLKADITYEDVTMTGRVRVKNIGTPNIKFRLDGIAGFEENFTWILDRGESKEWRYSGGVWSIEELSKDALSDWQTQLSMWVRGETNYTYEGATVRVYDIDVNPDLPDSLFQPPQLPYPVISATLQMYGDNEIIINVMAGSIPALEWAYSVSSTEGSYSWTTGTEELDTPYVSLGTYASGTWYVSLKHIDSGHLYFYDRSLTIS